jgi:hypothetical protein
MATVAERYGRPSIGLHWIIDCVYACIELREMYREISG